MSDNVTKFDPSRTVFDTGTAASNNAHTALATYMSEAPEESANLWRDSFIYRLLFPGASQRREFGQQLALQAEMLKYNDPSNQVARMLAAGLNPNAAVGQIASNGTPSASVPADTSQPLPTELIQQGAGALGSLVSTSLEAEEMPFRIDSLRAQAQQALSSAGVDDANASLISARIPYANYDSYLDVFGKVVTINNAMADYNNIRAQYNNILAQYDEIIANTSKMRSEEEVNKAMKDRLDVEVWFAQKDQEFWSAHGVRLADDRDNAILHAFLNGGEDSAQTIVDFFTKNEKEMSDYYSQQRINESWFSRPSNAYEAAASALKSAASWISDNKSAIGSLIEQGKTSIEEWKQNKAAKEEFDELYEDARSSLVMNLRDAKRAYRKVRFSGASDTYKAEMKRRRDNAKKELDEFTEEKFCKILQSRLSDN